MIYLDHHAQSPPDAEVLEAMARARADAWANPSSVHAAGRAARAVLERGREAIAAAIGARPAELVLTSGGTEAVNLGVLGLAPRARRVLTTEIEHPSVLEAIARLEADGADVIRLPVRGGVAPDPSELERLLPADLVAMQWVNHETGTLLPVAAYASACSSAGTPLFVDATQALGRVGIAVDTLGASVLAIASSKIGGPPGAGALWVRQGIDLEPRMLGGGQERGRRAGTLDVIAHAGFGAACARIDRWLDAMGAVAARRDRLEAFLVSQGAAVNGGEGPRAASVTNASVPGRRGSLLVAALDLEGVCAASGAACSSGLDRPSPVISAMYPSTPWRATGALRLSLAPSTSDADVDAACEALGRVLERGSTSFE